MSDYDLVIAGGGIHGAGVSQAAAARGYRVLLLERERIAAGTSSRSSKLIHGGLRYLETGQLRLVRESLQERAILARIAPDLVHWVPFHIPIAKGARRGPWTVRAGLSLYALLAGLGPHSSFRSLPASEWESLDGLRTADLRAVFRYWDAQTDDALLTNAVMRSAQKLGAELRCPAELIRAERRGDGVAVRYRHGTADVEVTAHALVNAAGPWLNSVLARVAPEVPPIPVELVQGTHVVLAGEIERGVYYLESPHDRRGVFVMPWQGSTLVGTTETAFRGDPGSVRPLESEIEYLLAVHRHYFPARPSELLASFAGLRVLPVGASSLFARPRETLLHAVPDRVPRVVTIAGGKLTAYRATARKTLARLAPALPPALRNLDTAELPLEIAEPAANRAVVHTK